MLIFRHLKDEDDIREYGFDSPIQQNQSDIAHKLVKQIILLSQTKNIEFLYATPRRFKESIDLMFIYFPQDYKISSKEDLRLNWIRDGKIKLDDNYIKGDRNSDIQNAWTIFTNEIVDGNYSYILGNPNGADKYYQNIERRYTEFGGTIFDLKPFLSLILDLIINNQNDIVLCCRHVAIRVILALKQYAETEKDLTIDFLLELYLYLNRNYGVTDFENYYGQVLDIDVETLNKENIVLGLKRIVEYMDKSMVNDNLSIKPLV